MVGERGRQEAPKRNHFLGGERDRVERQGERERERQTDRGEMDRRETEEREKWRGG
jgi:hypothetical protein